MGQEVGHDLEVLMAKVFQDVSPDYHVSQFDDVLKGVTTLG